MRLESGRNSELSLVVKPCRGIGMINLFRWKDCIVVDGCEMKVSTAQHKLE